MRLCDTKSRAALFDASWKVATVIPGSFPMDSHRLNDATLEFYMVNEDGSEDHPRQQEFYRCPVLGSYKLKDGILKPFSKSVNDPVMLVMVIPVSL